MWNNENGDPFPIISIVVGLRDIQIITKSDQQFFMIHEYRP